MIIEHLDELLIGFPLKGIPSNWPKLILEYFLEVLLALRYQASPRGHRGSIPTPNVASGRGPATQAPALAAD
jgi:hypothetical protein